MSRPLKEAAGLQPDNVQIVLLHSDDINAFVAGGQVVYVFSGLVTAAESANEVQGVIAHELGHITGGHVVHFGDNIEVATSITLLSLLLGAVALASGAGAAAAGNLSGGRAATRTRSLHYSRPKEPHTNQA